MEQDVFGAIVIRLDPQAVIATLRRDNVCANLELEEPRDVIVV